MPTIGANSDLDNHRPHDDAGIAFPEHDESAWSDKSLQNTRNGARQLALRVLYWETTLQGDLENALTNLGTRHKISESNLRFATALVRTVIEHRNHLDDTIASAATNWSRDRLARLDALILKIALAEIFHFDEIPVKVSLDEAVELARIYGAEQSYAFVNGVLDAIVQQCKRP